MSFHPFGLITHVLAELPATQGVDVSAVFLFPKTQQQPFLQIKGLSVIASEFVQSILNIPADFLVRLGQLLRNHIEGAFDKLALLVGLGVGVVDRGNEIPQRRVAYIKVRQFLSKLPRQQRMQLIFTHEVRSAKVVKVMV